MKKINYRTFSKLGIFLLISLIAFLLVSCATQGKDKNADVNLSSAEKASRAKNIIVLIADGCSAEQYTFARWYKGEPLSFDEMLTGGIKTYTADSVVADSAPAATAFASRCKNLAEVLKQRGYRIVENRDQMKTVTSGKVFGMFASSYATLEDNEYETSYLSGKFDWENNSSTGVWLGVNYTNCYLYGGQPNLILDDSGDQVISTLGFKTRLGSIGKIKFTGAHQYYEHPQQYNKGLYLVNNNLVLNSDIDRLYDWTVERFPTELQTNFYLGNHNILTAGVFWCREIDVIADVGAVLPEQAQSLKNNPDIVLKQVQVATTHILLFNCRALPFSELEVRLWFAGILNRSQLVEVFAKGAGIEAKEPFTPLSADFAFGLIQPKNKPLPKIVQGTSVVILLSNATLQRWPYLNMAQVIEEMLRSYGFAPKIEIKEMGDYHEAIKKGNFNIAVQPYTLMTGDPDFFYAYWIA